MFWEYKARLGGLELAKFERGYLLEKFPYIVIPLMVISAFCALGLVVAVIYFLLEPSWKTFFYCVILWLIVVFPYHIDYIADFLLGSIEMTASSVKDNVMDKKEKPEIPTFNLSQLNLLELSDELKKSLQTPSSSFIFFRERENTKLELQRRKVELILETIKKMTSTQQELIKYQAETFLSNTMLDAVVEERKFEINSLAEAAKKRELLHHKSMDDEISRLEHSKKSRELLLEAGEIDNLRRRAELNLMTSQNNEAKAKAELIMYVLKELDLKNMPQTLQTYLITSIVNPQGSQYQDFDMQEQLKKFVIKDADAKSRQSSAIATQAEHQTRIAEKTADKTVFDLDTIRNSTKRD